MGLLEGRNCVITGASRGLGARIAARFWSEGVSLLLIARSREALEGVVSSLPVKAQQRAFIFPCDLSDPSVPMRVAAEITDRFGQFHVLVNNAAIQGPIGPSWTGDGSAWEEAIRVDLLAPIALCRKCIPLMDRRIRAKIINLSGGGAAAARPNFSAYATAQAGLVRFSEVLAEETKQMGIDVNCIAPGAMDTAMTDAILNAGSEAAGSEECQKATRLRQQGGSKIDMAADLAAFLASSASDSITGKLISAVWDPWETLPEHIEELRNTDIYTLRRIVPKDRGYDWGER